MRLAHYILANVDSILTEWDAFAGSLASGSTMARLALRDDGEAILRASARDMQREQSLAQQASKSRAPGGLHTPESRRLNDASARHGVDRLVSGFDINGVVSVYRELRASVLRLWRESLPQPELGDIDDITRFNKAIDQSLAEAVRSYSERVNRSRNLFLAMLGHDLRNPLNAIKMGANLLSHKDVDRESVELLSVMATESDAMERLIGDLLHFASTRLGKSMPLVREQVNLQKLCGEVIDGFRAAHPRHTLHFHPRGDITGSWDAARLRQVVSNLLGNALQHGSPDGPVELSVASEGPTVVLSVHNEGAPIPPEAIATLFDPLVRHATADSSAARAPGSIGLGLYIVREIVDAKGGTITVASTAGQGTTFTVRIPRHAEPLERTTAGEIKRD